MKQLWIRRVSLLWFVPWLLFGNLKGCSSKADKWIVSFPQSKLLSNSRNIICSVGTRTDFSRWIVNPSSRKSATVALIFLKQISKVSPSSSESSIYFMDKCSFDLGNLNGGAKTFVKTLTAGENPLGRTIYGYYSSFQNNFRYFW